MINRKLKVLSLFDGCAGARQALDNLGIDCEYYASEIDKYAIEIAMKNYPDIIQLGDITKLDQSNLPTGIDLLIGGSPCQSFSRAARNKDSGLKTGASQLFWEYARILNIVKPKYFILENVSSMKALDRAVIDETLKQQAIKINSNLLTAQNRSRLYWSNFPIKQPKNKHIYWSGPVFYYGRSALGKEERQKIKQATGLDKGGDRSKMTREWTLRSDRKVSVITSNPDVRVGLEKRTLNVQERESLQGMRIDYTKGVSLRQRYKMIGNGFTIPVIEHLISEMLRHES